MYQSLPKKKKIQTNNKIQTIKTIRTIEKNRYKKNMEIMVDSFYFILL